MKIQSLQLKNFRCFKNESIQFHDRLTVLVGVNGSGKTAILEAIAMILGGVVRYAVSNEVWRYNLEHKDTIFSSKENASIEANFRAFGEIFTWIDPVIEESKDGFVKTRIVNYGKNSNREFINRLIDLQNAYPVIAYYSSYRLLGNAVSSGERNFDRNRLDAYISCFAPEVDFNRIITWLDALDASEARSIRAGESETTYSELKTLRDAVNRSLPGYKNFRFINVPPEFALTRIKDGQIITFRQLSAGYRIMFALVLDLARRMAVANGDIFAQQEKSALESPAVVLIDEVELHLHPSWQQTVLPSLMAIFPNTQFIVTTHSPQVLTSIPSECIRILHEGKAEPIEHGTLGAESAQVLEDIFKVPSRPDWLTIPSAEGSQQYPLNKKIARYFELIEADLFDSEDAKTIRSELEKLLPGDPMLVRATAQIERARRLKKRREGHA